MLRFSAPFPTPLTPLDPFRFIYVFVNILAPFSYFCLLPLFPVSLIIFAAPWFLLIPNLTLKFWISWRPFLSRFLFHWLLLFWSFPIVTHGSPPVCFSFYILFSFDFFPLFLFFCIFSSPSLLSFFGAPFLFPFFLSLSLLLSFSPLLFGAPLRPPGVQAHAMHPPGYATENYQVTRW